MFTFERFNVKKLSRPPEKCEGKKILLQTEVASVDLVAAAAITNQYCAGPTFGQRGDWVQEGSHDAAHLPLNKRTGPGKTWPTDAGAEVKFIKLSYQTRATNHFPAHLDARLYSKITTNSILIFTLSDYPQKARRFPSLSEEKSRDVERYT